MYGILGYLKWGITRSLEFSGHKQYPFHELGENDSTYVVLHVGFGRFMQYPT
jgi:hypothetical protein